jgi:RNA polymerase sigma-70 factor (sigma-E family)
VLSRQSFVNEFVPDDPASQRLVPDGVVADGPVAGGLVPGAEDTEVSDHELVYHEDLDAYVRRQGATLRRSAFLLTGDRHLAEDLVQVSLAKVAPRWDRLVAAGDPTAYVRKVIVHTAVGWRRRRWTAELPTAPLPDAVVRDETAAVDARERLRRALLQVPVRQRAAVVLRFYEDLSEADTAEVLGCSVGTVKSQTAKGLARIRALLGSDE